MMRWKRIDEGRLGCKYYATGHGFRAVIYTYHDNELAVTNVYQEVGGNNIASQVHPTLTAAKRWANTFLKGTK